MIFDDYDDSYDIQQLQRLPMYWGMTEKEIRIVVQKMSAMEKQQWIDEVKAMLADQRKKTLDYMAKQEANGVKPQTSDPVQIQWGITVSPDMVDDKGFVSKEAVTGRKPTLKLFLDANRKIYINR